MLDHIKIKGYKSIRDLEIDLDMITLLIGSNGVGKSNFISFFKLVNNIYEQRLQQYSRKNGVESLLHFGSKNTNYIEGHLKFGDNAYNFELEPTESDTLYIVQEDSIYFPNNRNTSFYNKNLQESLIKNSNNYRDNYLREHLETLKIYHFHDTSSASPLRTPANINDNRTLKENGDNLAAYLYYLQEKHPKSFKRIEKTIASIAPFFERFNLEPDRLDETRIKLIWNEVDHPDTYFDANHLSDGSLRFMALTTLLLQPDLPRIIIIDEPELGLHPVAVNKLAGLIKSAAAKGCQVIVSTQSVNLLNNFEPQNIITVDKVDNQSSFDRLHDNDLDKWLEDYSMGELWTKSIIKGQPQ